MQQSVIGINWLIMLWKEYSSKGYIEVLSRGTYECDLMELDSLQR